MEKEFNNNESEQQRKTLRDASEELCEMYKQWPKRDEWSWEDMIEGCRVDMTAPGKPYEYRLDVGGMKIDGKGSITSLGGIKIAYEGSIVSVGATEYLVMTVFLAALVSVMISGRPFGNIERGTPPKKILWIDTARRKRAVENIMRIVYKLAGIPEDTPLEKVGLYALSLRQFLIDERGAIIQGAIDSLNPDVVIIDDVEALLYDYMNVNESNCVVDWLGRNAEDRTIFATMLTNENNNRKRGYLGTKLGIESFDELTIIKKEYGYKVTLEQNHEPIKFREEIAFNIDQNALPVLNVEFDDPLL